MKLSKLTRKAIQQRCDKKIFERGKDYYRSGHVQGRLRTARGLKATVQGTVIYHVSIREQRKDLIAICTCPYGQSWGGDCKHIVAVLLTWLEEPESFAQASDLHKTLKKKTHEELVELLGQICEVYPQIAQDFLGVGASAFDPRMAVRGALNALESPEEYTAGELMQRLEPIAQRAEAALVRGDAETARKIFLELILGCLRADEEYGSTEIFPDGLVYSYVQGYHEVVEGDPEREQKIDVILGEITQMEQSELVEIEGVEFEELRKWLMNEKEK